MHFPSLPSTLKKKISIKRAESTCSVINRTQKVDALIFLRNRNCFTLQWLKRGLWRQTNLGFIPF